MKRLKDNGITEIRALRKRVVRAFAMRRISKADHDYLLERANQIEARIIEMVEYDGEEED